MLQITCGKCVIQYVGSTEKSLAIRTDNHRYAIGHETNDIGKHFAVCGYEHFGIQIIDQTSSPVNLTSREGYWQNTLMTLTPWGLNKRNELQSSRQIFTKFPGVPDKKRKILAPSTQ